jgi:eukaryotic-like serine/threonine-protein kinase
MRCLHLQNNRLSTTAKRSHTPTPKTLPANDHVIQSLVLPPHLAALQDSRSPNEYPCHTQPPQKFTSAITTPGRVELFDRSQPTSPDLSCPSNTNVHGQLAANAIPGYRIDEVIGVGGMGTVYLARQISLDRPVALKVMSKVWAADPVFVARFVREAYAAAQLNHTNVVQIYDIGELNNGRYFSMEYVVGKSLADVIKTQGKVEVETAIGYILQAARGLKHAHDRGIIHRDIKPDNLLLDSHGVVKVADLGLVKTPDLTAQEDSVIDERRCGDSGLHTLPPGMTGVRMALGTPAYMAPEQCRDAATVDHRADIYSLGCTLYALLTGTQPFHAPDSFALMKKQAYEPATPPEQLNPRIPYEISLVVTRMMAKQPGDRFRSMGEVIRTLELWLGVHSNVKFQPCEKEIGEVEQLASAFFAAPTASRRQRVVSGFVSTAALAALLSLFFGRISYAFGLAGMVLQSAIAYFVVTGWTRETYLFHRLKRFAVGMSIGDWLVTTGAAGLFIAFLATSNLMAVWFGFGLIGVAAAVVLAYGFDHKLALERFPTIQATDDLMHRLQERRIPEAEAKLFMAKYAGRQWEEFFEAVFGYEAKLVVRGELRGGSVGTRVRYATWREPLIQLLNHIDSQRRTARERRMLVQAEYSRLVASGVSRRRAWDKAIVTAESLVEQASAIRQSDLNHPDAASHSGAIAFRMLQPGCMAGQTNTDAPPQDRFGDVIDWLIGKPMRGTIAALLVAMCAVWVYQNQLIRFTIPGPDELTIAPLVIDGIPTEWTNWCDSANVGWGGMLLMASLFFRGHRQAMLSLLGAAVTVFGHKLGIRTVEPIRDYHVAMFLGTVLALVGYRLGRR